MNRILITEEQINKAFANTNFGNSNKLDLIKESLLKVACGYATGHTIQEIGMELGLRKKTGGLSKKGQEYLYQAYEDKSPYFTVDAVKRINEFSGVAEDLKKIIELTDDNSTNQPSMNWQKVNFIAEEALKKIQ